MTNWGISEENSGALGGTLAMLSALQDEAASGCPAERRMHEKCAVLAASPEATTAEAAPTASHQGRDHRMGGPGNRGGGSAAFPSWQRPDSGCFVRTEAPA